MLRRKSWISFLALGAAGVGAYRARRQWLARWLKTGPARYPVSVRRNVKIPMADGVLLAADHYAPITRPSHSPGARQPAFPTVLIRTPYGRSPRVGGSGVMAAFAAQRFAERGYHVVVQDVRGRFGSGSDFVPFMHEAQDGMATLEWIQAQPWFDGQVAMWGQSYLGYVQWAAAVQAPTILKALLPSITGSDLPLLGIRDGVPSMMDPLRWILLLDAMDRKEWIHRLKGMARFLPPVQESLLRRALLNVSLVEADRVLVGQPVPFYQDWMSFPDPQAPYWQAVTLGARLQNVTAAVHLISGWYDIFLHELLDDYQRLSAAGRPPYLTIGPWHHLSQECWWESLREGIVWFDAILKGDRSRLRLDPVRIYVMGDGTHTGWRSMESWPPPATECKLFLQAGGQLVEAPSEETASVSEYIYDPHDPTPAVGGTMMNNKAGRKDNRALEARPDVLTFTTQPLENDLEVIGSARLVLWVRSSGEGTDFFTRLCDVAPDGKSLNVCDALVRLGQGRQELQADGAVKIEINLAPTANRFGRGHRVRLQVSSGAHPRWLPDERITQPVFQTIYHDLSHPSALYLPKTDSR